KNPWKDSKLKSSPAAYTRELDENGVLLPIGRKGVTQLKLAPLNVYSLNYPKMPLLLVDFRNTMHIKWHEMTQRSINEVTAGIIGISHFTNWYYYLAADLYDFIESRHGSAVNLASRLDCYSQFRVKLQLDDQLDARLRHEMEQRVNSLAVNPLEGEPQSETAAAVRRFGLLEEEAATGRLAERVERNRRAELAMDSETKNGVLRDYFLHIATLGTYTHLAK